MIVCTVRHVPGSDAQRSCPVHGLVAPKQRASASASPDMLNGMSRRERARYIDQIRDDNLLAVLAQSSDVETRASVASSDNTPFRVVEALSWDESSLVRIRVATSHLVATGRMNHLAQDENAGVRVRMAGNLHTPPRLLGPLSQDEDRTIRVAVARHPKCPADAAWTLAQDDDPRVVEALARQTVHRDVLSDLATRESRHVRARVASNAYTPYSALESLSRAPEPTIRATVAEHRSLSDDLLSALGKDEVALVRKMVAENPDTPEHMRGMLMSDPDAEVAAAARDMATLDIEFRFGVSRLSNPEASRMLLDLDRWWERDVADDAVVLIMTMHPNR